MTITPEQKQAVERVGQEPVRVEDPETRTAYLIVREDVYRKMRELITVPESDFTLKEFEEFLPAP